jgi:hypothetical protein
VTAGRTFERFKPLLSVFANHGAMTDYPGMRNDPLAVFPDADAQFALDPALKKKPPHRNRSWQAGDQPERHFPGYHVDG